jgi:hypothetical protein
MNFQNIRAFEIIIDINNQEIPIQRFYDRILRSNDLNIVDKRLDYILSGKTVFGKICHNAAAFFAYRMASETSANDNFCDLQCFCAYFEFIFAYFMRDFHLNRGFNDFQLYCREKIEGDENRKERNFELICNRYHQLAFMVHENICLIGEHSSVHKDVLRQIEYSANLEELKFISTTSAVYHWYKHSTKFLIDTEISILPADYFKDANAVVSSAITNKNYKQDSRVFRFESVEESKNQRSKRVEKLRKIVIVTKTQPFRILSFQIYSKLAKKAR